MARAGRGTAARPVTPHTDRRRCRAGAGHADPARAVRPAGGARPSPHQPAPILLIDEATSALDTENERVIVAALGAGSAPRTRVIVAHRLASIRTADRVLFLEGGRIAEDGTVDDLLAAGGRFAEFWRGQEATAGWRITAAEGVPLAP